MSERPPEHGQTPDDASLAPNGEASVVLVRRQPFWRRIGGDGLVVSMVIHVGLLLLFAAWVVSSWTDMAKTDPETFATGQGGGTQGTKAKVYPQKIQPKNAKNLTKNQARITTKSTSSTLALPDLPTTSAPSLTSGLTGGGSSKGGGGGSGGGFGTGQGMGVGNGKNLVGAFGANFRRANALEGTLYDLKFAPGGKSLGGESAQRVAQMKRAFDSLDGGWSGAKKLLDQRYRQAELKLYAGNIFVPPRNAAEATKAFECEKEIQAPGWLAYYEGWFAVPESGQYRFVGLGDDMMAVAVSEKTVYAAFWPGSGLGKVVKFGNNWLPKGADDNDGRNLRFPPNAGGRYSGEWMDLKKGQAYRIQVAFAESFGGLFGAQLLIERKGEKYQNNGREDLLPIFMLEPMSAEEIKLKQAQNLDYVTEGPSFGCEINKVTVRQTSR